MYEVITDTNLPLKKLNKGKVRDIYEVNHNTLLIVTTDRISAFDVVLPNPIPSKGICLNQLSKFWFNYFKSIIPNHMISTDLSSFPDQVKPYEKQVKYRSMLVKKTRVIPIECIVRGYISGSAWQSYKKDGTVCGIKLRKGLKESDKLDEPLFTPSTKASTGHDINISFKEAEEITGGETANKIRDYSIEIYNKASAYAEKRGIIIADTKFEFGLLNDKIILIDEVLTPDSSRFWPADGYKPGGPQPSFDKQYVRDYLDSIKWDKKSSPPSLPEEVIINTQRKYQEAYERITGGRFTFDV
jgi:phosphoribosylaminoimidazole-succinocarboxamide synthase